LPYLRFKWGRAAMTTRISEAGLLVLETNKGSGEIADQGRRKGEASLMRVGQKKKKGAVRIGPSTLLPDVVAENKNKCGTWEG